MLKVLEVIRKLRAPTGCPWNGSRTSKDLLYAAREELLELETALEQGITWQVKDELGDVLFNILALCELQREKGLFTLDEIDTTVAQKMIRRHPYVFGSEPDPGPEGAVEQWRQIKQQEEIEKYEMRAGISFSAIITHYSEECKTLAFLTKFSRFFASITLTEPFDISLSISPTGDIDNILVRAIPPDYLYLQVSIASKVIVVCGFSTRRFDPASVQSEAILAHNELTTAKIEYQWNSVGNTKLDWKAKHL